MEISCSFIFEQALRDEAVHLVVIDDEDMRVGHDERGRMHVLALGHAFRIERTDGFFRPHAQRNPRREDRAFAIGALDRDRAAHAAGETEREREAEARALDVAVALRIEAYEVAEQPLPALLSPSAAGSAQRASRAALQGVDSLRCMYTSQPLRFVSASFRIK